MTGKKKKEGEFNKKERKKKQSKSDRAIGGGKWIKNENDSHLENLFEISFLNRKKAIFSD